MLTRMGVTTRGTEVWLNKRVAEADKVILLNALSTHDMAGFGGGRKLVLPGVAGGIPSSRTTATPWATKSLAESRFPCP